MALFDIKAAQQQAEKEVAEEESKAAVAKIKAHLKRISAARAVVVNLEREYEVLLREAGSNASEA